MKELGSTIECYRGEAFTWRREFVDQDGAPLVLTPQMRNPFLRFTVKSNTYKIDGEYVKNYWQDLSAMRRFTGVEPFPDNKIPLTGLAVEMSEDLLDKATTSDDTSIISSFHRENETYATIAPPSNAWTFNTPELAGQSWSFTLPVNISNGKIRVRLNSFTISSITLSDGTNSVETTYKYPVTTIELYTKGTDKLIFTFTREVPGGNPNVTIGNITYVNALDKRVLYYVVSSEGREYYCYNERNDSWEKYHFAMASKFINADTKKWIGQIYQYEIALCSGELMTDWLTKVFKSLYPDVDAPAANAELAHYICKKRPDLLEGVNVYEPLVSYGTNQVLLGPSKLIVKEN